MSRAHTLIVGIGSPHGDDQAGWLVAERLAALDGSGGVSVRQAKSPIEVLDWLEGIERLILCDACQGLGPVGQRHRWGWPAPELAAVSWSGTHDFPLPAALKLAEQLGRLPENLCIWSIEGAIGHGLSPLSAAVEAALPKIAQEVAREVIPEFIDKANPCTSSQS